MTYQFRKSLKGGALKWRYKAGRNNNAFLGALAVEQESACAVTTDSALNEHILREERSVSLQLNRDSCNSPLVVWNAQCGGYIRSLFLNWCKTADRTMDVLWNIVKPMFFSLSTFLTPTRSLWSLGLSSHCYRRYLNLRGWQHPELFPVWFLEKNEQGVFLNVETPS
ncbi:hypothetical protein HPB50_002866 [Hyalomma asiaticum]|uniref:Uncharacterized protein n=1 Tax=Hyalomma asiaticum TaxID=266040 RepID=A0ACB7RUA3_HYAAI|nr:hypothetical protein HPB50_002866 [Hyalomma asiaticum]